MFGSVIAGAIGFWAAHEALKQLEQAVAKQNAVKAVKLMGLITLQLMMTVFFLAATVIRVL